MFEKFFEIIEKKLQQLKDQELYRSIIDMETAEGMKITIKGRSYINFASNDYLGLSKHPLVKKSAHKAIELFGAGSGAARLLSGGTLIHKELEKLICKFKDSEASLVLNSGYTANSCLIPAIADEDDLILSDELNHASIIDGCRLSRAKKLIYRHKDLQHLIRLIKDTPCNGKKIIITDTVFSMDGDIAPIREIYELCKSEEALLYIDDAHGTGILGEGHGTLKHFGLSADNFVIQMGTLSKAVGCFGAFVCGTDILINWFINSARGFIFSTALPSSVVASSYASLKIIMEDKTLIKKLWKNTQRVMNTIKTLKLSTTDTQTPIIPILFENIEDAMRASNILHNSGIYAPVIKPPTVRTPRIRISISAGHTEEDIERLNKALINLYQQPHQA